MWSFASGRYLSEKEVKVRIDLANVQFCSIKSNTQSHMELYVCWGLIRFYTATRSYQQFPLTKKNTVAYRSTVMVLDAMEIN